MSTVMIVLILVIVVVVAISLVLGRMSQEVESARDTEYVELEGRWVRYNVIGGGPPVVLVHGWLSSSRIWEPLARRLAQRFTVYTLDLVGFGESDKPTSGYGARYGSRLLYAFCAHFGLARATIVGHDIGGVMAIKLAADHPDLVGRLVLVATPADEEQIDLPTLLWLATLPVIGPIFYSLGRLLRPVRKLWMRNFVFDRKDLPDELVEDAGRSTPAAMSKTFTVTRHEIAGGRVARQARIIRVPILLVAGEDDQIADPRAVSDWGQYAGQSEIALFDKCGHLPMIELPSEFSARALAFMTGDSRYLEYVKEVPSPITEEVPEEPEELQDEAPKQEQPPPPERDISSEEDAIPGEATAERDSSFGDLQWDFSPKRPVTPRSGERMTGPAEEPVPKDEGTGSSRDVSESQWPAASPPDRDSEARPAARNEAAEPQERRENRDRQPGNIPEFPEDLFQWSEPPGEFRPGQRSRRSRRKRAVGDEDVLDEKE